MKTKSQLLELVKSYRFDQKYTSFCTVLGIKRCKFIQSNKIIIKLNDSILS